MKIELHPRFLKRIKKLDQPERNRVAESLRELADGFGNPHLHSGLSIRRLRKDLFECRSGLHFRIIFLAEEGVLTVYDLMTHDEVQAWLRSF